MPELSEDEPIVAAKKYIDYKKANGHIKNVKFPKIVLVCYQNTALYHIKERYPEMTHCECFCDFYFMPFHSKSPSFV